MRTRGAWRALVPLMLLGSVFFGVPAGPAGAGVAEPPVAVELPTVSGDAVYRGLLVADPGTWTGEGELEHAYRWFREEQEIDGATRPRYRPGLDDLGHRLHVVVTTTDESGQSGTAASEPTDRVRKASFAVAERPSVDGVARFTRRLTADPGTWQPRRHAVRYRWFRGDRPITGATSRRYRLQAADVGERVRVRVTVRKEGYRVARAFSRGRKVGHLVPVRRSVTYRIETRGRITASMKVFRRQVAQTLADPRGWRSAGVSFRRVASGGSFSVVLAEASTVPSFSPVCSASWSCRVGRYVIINQMRWQHATPSWNHARKSLRSYRHMVLNHETGHWLGHGHLGCGGRGQLAPVMMQQSKGLDGCRHNPWPLPSERWYR
ncbi:DUF3152 domain-containing protein [Nocardioides sp. GCM10027113]|uniref:DUF3152 domain-containing protein n=1 Tax=unclassified Nocardioides TaxID=2615069 RepID=UPI00361AC60D